MTGRCYVCGRDGVELCSNKKCKPCMSDYKKKWYAANKATIRKKQEEYRSANRSKLREADKIWRRDNKGKDAIRVSKWAKNHPEKRAESQRKRRARKTGSQILPITIDMLAMRLEVFGGRCAYCGGPFEHWDHFKPLELGGPHILANMRPSCISCNISKGCKHPIAWMAQFESHSV